MRRRRRLARSTVAPSTPKIPAPAGFAPGIAAQETPALPSAWQLAPSQLLLPSA
jgi:hypothetical protein